MLKNFGGIKYTPLPENILRETSFCRSKFPAESHVSVDNPVYLLDPIFFPIIIQVLHSPPGTAGKPAFFLNDVIRKRGQSKRQHVLKWKMKLEEARYIIIISGCSLLVISIHTGTCFITSCSNLISFKKLLANIEMI